jgi:hypothetical protein
VDDRVDAFEVGTGNLTNVLGDGGEVGGRSRTELGLVKVIGVETNHVVAGFGDVRRHQTADVSVSPRD